MNICERREVCDGTVYGAETRVFFCPHMHMNIQNLIIIIIIIVRGEFLSLSVWYCDTLNSSFGVFLSFLKNVSTAPFYFSYL